MVSNRWNPWAEMQSEMARLQGDMNRLFGRYGAPNGRSFTPSSYPALNIWEDDEQLFVEAELPGMDLNDLQIYVNSGNQLSISGERKPPVDSEGNWHRKERGYGKFARVVELPNHVDADRVQGNFKDGVLTISLHKQEASKPRKIEVKGE